jgi:hypothetical protein
MGYSLERACAVSITTCMKFATVRGQPVEIDFQNSEQTLPENKPRLSLVKFKWSANVGKSDSGWDCRSDRGRVALLRFPRSTISSSTFLVQSLTVAGLFDG